MSTTTVVNVRSPEWEVAKRAGTAVYVGRACAGFKGSIFGNPWKVGGSIKRGKAIYFYRGWAEGKWLNGQGKPFPHDQLESLRGKVLGCWCHPEACHADVLVELLASTAAVAGKD